MRLQGSQIRAHVRFEDAGVPLADKPVMTLCHRRWHAVHLHEDYLLERGMFLS